MKFLTLLLAANLAAQTTLTLIPSATSVKPGGQFTLRVVHAASPAAVVAGLQWNLVAPVGFTATPASALPASLGKNLYADPASMILLGLNTTVIPVGDVATYTVTVPANASGPLSFSLTKLLGVDKAGVAVTVTSGAAVTVTLLSRFDLDNNGVIDGKDLQILVSQINGVTACTSDLNGDGACTLIDAMALVLGSLGLIP